MDGTIKLDKKERLFLSNQLEILMNQFEIKNLFKGTDDPTVDLSSYKNQIRALREGYELHYSDVFEDIYDELSLEECRFVLDVLEMYRGITFSFFALRRDNMLGSLTEEKILFEGFDLNTETKYFSYAKYFLFDLDRYEEIKQIAGPFYDFNSHTCATIPKYRKQLSIWEGYRSLENRYQMSEDQINKILQA